MGWGQWEEGITGTTIKDTCMVFFYMYTIMLRKFPSVFTLEVILIINDVEFCPMTMLFYSINLVVNRTVVTDF